MKKKNQIKTVGASIVRPYFGEISKNYRGITLIALIITIIVMLILVGVTVTVALNGGLFNTAKHAARKTEKAKLNEELQTIISAMNVDIYTTPEKHKLTLGDLPEGIEEGEGFDELSEEQATELMWAIYLEKAVENIEENFTIKESIIKTYNYKTEEFTSANIYALLNEQCIDGDSFGENGIYVVNFPCKYKDTIELNITVEMKINDTDKDITEMEPNDTIIEVVSYKIDTDNRTTKITEITEKVELTEAEENIKEIKDGVPIPKGFYYVTGTKDTGLVISDNANDENNASGNAGNQFVWVPVEINPKLKIEINSDKIIKEVKVLNYNGYEKTYNPNNYEFLEIINLTGNEIYEIITTFNDETVETNLYFASTVYKNYDEARGFLKLYTAASGDSLQKILDDLKAGYENENEGVKVNSYTELIRLFLSEQLENLEDETPEKDSVFKYGGFYIGRYEMTANGEIKKGVSPARGIEYDEAKTFVETLYNADKGFGVQSTLPSGAAWDRTMQWLLDTRAITEEDAYLKNNNGNFKKYINSSDNPVIDYTAKYTTGENRIYDLTGNVNEWTTTQKINTTTDEQGNTTETKARLTRGGSADDVGLVSVYKMDESVRGGGRPILYIYE